ncbi:hypothetical protein PHYSODRAFT_500618 [Phytophthora sojae]|uniref:DDE-1 domain-containing protein n=1 Tax=Phytophthora sojae (strain P6497) TaxID=1094619 RepID=G4ZDV2_PHYSP|nr:hypothetical protein PHYSODRAFT_500618 [Phytophthora sojae]EGZ19031.1 hypothetical protein PHYSODRAFT_500618 [Phytophthora sojae]|eukprot:XP_009528089.1 hypothetical protein PHYSODRAFT_500618 [Phytophthora sojae]
MYCSGRLALLLLHLAPQAHLLPHSTHLTALLWCEDAWSKVSASTIRHCWNHSGLVGKAALQFILK